MHGNIHKIKKISQINTTELEHLKTHQIKHDGCLLRYVENKTEDICLEAVRQNGRALQYVKEQTPEICEEAVNQCKDALQYVRAKD